MRNAVRREEYLGVDGAELREKVRSGGGRICPGRRSFYDVLSGVVFQKNDVLGLGLGVSFRSVGGCGGDFCDCQISMYLFIYSFGSYFC